MFTDGQYSDLYATCKTFQTTEFVLYDQFFKVKSCELYVKNIYFK